MYVKQHTFQINELPELETKSRQNLQKSQT